MPTRTEARFAAPLGRSPARRLLPLALLAMELSATAVASAQQRTPAVARVTRERTTGAYRTTRPWWISRQDCLDDMTFVFTVDGVTPNDNLEVWVGSENCADRRGDEEDRGQCWIVGGDSAPSAQNAVVRVPARRVVARRTGTTQVPTGDDEPGPEVCDDDDDQNGQQVTFYFVLEDGGQSVAHSTWPPAGGEGAGFDLLGPDPPGSIRMGIGDRQLSVELNDVVEAGDRNRFEAYCVEAFTGVEEAAAAAAANADAGREVAAALVDAAVGPDAAIALGPAGPLDAGANDAATPADDDAAPAQCFTPLLRRGALPPAGFACGSVSETTQTLTTDPLGNGTVYAVGVVGKDSLGNVGVLSDIECGRPLDLDNFYELYTRAGGPGGGGFCSISRGSTAGGSTAASIAALLGAGALLLGRRRARRAP